MEIFKHVAICSFLASAKKYNRKTDGDRGTNDRSIYDDKDPTKDCTFSGEHAITGEDGFGEGYGYNLDYQSDRMGLSGFVSVENYYDYMNCYVEVNANPGCDSVEVTLTSLAIEDWGDSDHCSVDYAYLTDLNGQKSDKLCGCKGDGCSDLVWGRNVTDPLTGYEYTYPYNDYDFYGAGDYNYTYMEEYWYMASTGQPNEDKWRLAGNGFRLNIQSDSAVSHGEIKLEWACVEDSTTTSVTSTAASTLSSADSTWNPYMTSEGDSKASCAMYHNDLDSFFSQIRVGINNAIENELLDTHSNRKSRFKNWMTKVWTKFENQLNGQATMFDSDAKHRNCIMESVTNSPGENLSTEILGSDCSLDLGNQGISHMCLSLTKFMNFAYSKCLTRGRGTIHWASSEEEGQMPFNSENENDTQGLLDRLEFRCNRMLEIIS